MNSQSENAPSRSDDELSSRILTIPNGLSMLRLLGIPLFAWLVLGPKEYVWATALLVVSGATDWFDGYLARVLNQASRLGQMLDPLVDRMYIVATLMTLVVADVVPWWLGALIVGRDVMLLVLSPIWLRRGYTAVAVSFIGKAATMILLYTFPAFLLGAADIPGAQTLTSVAWALAFWGIGTYWLAAALYVVQTVQIASEKPGE